jgi:hypothetical protein
MNERDIFRFSWNFHEFCPSLKISFRHLFGDLAAEFGNGVTSGRIFLDIDDVYKNMKYTWRLQIWLLIWNSIDLQYKTSVLGFPSPVTQGQVQFWSRRVVNYVPLSLWQVENLNLL